MLIGAAAGALLALFTLSPAGAAPAGSYTAVSDGTALSLNVADLLALDAGITHAELDSTPHAAGSGAGLVQAPTTIAETDAPPDDAAVADLLAPIVIGDPASAGVSVEVGHGESTSEVSGDPSSRNEGFIAGVVLNVANLVGSDAFAVRSTADTVVDGQIVTAEAHSDEVKIVLKLSDQLVSPVCDVLDTLPLGLGDACRGAVDEVQELATVATIRILPADVVCQYDGNTETASVPVAEAALLSVQLFNAEPISVSPGQTIDLLDGTPLHIHAEIGTASTNVDGNEASARASALVLNLFDADLPEVDLIASEVTCGVAGELPPPTSSVPRTPVTGGVLPPVILGAAGLLLVGFGARRFAKVS